VRLADNYHLAMTLQGIPNRIYSLQYGTNLTNWSLLSYLTNTAGTLIFTNSMPAGLDRCFYRVKEGAN
jgi:hypothetical protein